MKTIHRRAITTVGLLAAVAIGAPTLASAQGRGGPRGAMFVAVTFHAPGESKLGVDVAEAVRQQMIRLFPQPPRAGGLRVITREQVNAQLTAAGYPSDSAISTTDLRDLGRNIGADETMEGTATRTADGVKLIAHFYSLNNTAAPEILPVIVDKDANNAAKRLADSYAKARKELPDYERCKNAIIAGNFDLAVDAAKAAMLQYNLGVLPLACQMSAYLRLAEAKKMPVDSVVRVAQEVLTRDADNELAIGVLADAFLAKGDTARAIEMNVKLYHLNPTNQSQAETIIGILASTGAPQQALPIVKDMIANNPGDAKTLELYWKLLQATKQWKQAIATGEEMVKFDSSRADTTYFNRQIAAAIADSQPALVLQYLGKATTKFPKSTRYWLGYSQELNRQGQTQAALNAVKRALAIDPKIDNGYAKVLQLYVALGQADSALAFAKVALAAGADKDNIGNALLTLISPAMTKAQAADSNQQAWEEVYHMSAVVDSIAPQATTAFFMSFSAFKIATTVLQRVPELQRTDRPKACAELKYASDMVMVVDLNMARGGRYKPDAAANILNALGTSVKPYIESSKKSLNCK